jgi:hypothetical protein
LDWWSLKPIPQASTLQMALEPSAPANPLDAFIDALIKQKGLIVNRRAPDDVLVRRLVFDLTGLPPTQEQITAYSSIGHDAMFDRLLSQPEFGEKWGATLVGCRPLCRNAWL